MIISFTNVIGAIRSLGEAAQVITTNLKMWLGFETSETLGREEVVNGDFATDSDWTKRNGSTINNVANVIASGTIGSTSFNWSLESSDNVFEPSKYYQIKFRAKQVSSAGSIAGAFQVGNSFGTLFDEVITSEFVDYTFTAQASSNNWPKLTIGGRIAGDVFQIDDISVKELTQITPDKSGNNNVGELFTGKAIEFNGAGNYVDITGFSMSGSVSTFAFWINSNDTLGRIIDINPNRFIISFNNNQLSLYDGNWKNFGTINTNFWNRCVIVTSGTSAKCYVNGVQLGVEKTISALRINSATDAIIGANYVHTQSFFDGEISDFQIYNAAWNTDDIAYDYANPQNLVTDRDNPTIALSNLKAYWAMSEGAGSLAYNSAVALGNDAVVDGDFPLPNVNWTLVNEAQITVNGLKIDNTVSGNFVGGKQFLTNNPFGKTFVATYDVIDTNGAELAIQQVPDVTLDTTTIGTNKKTTFTWSRIIPELTIKRTLGTGVNVTIDNFSLQEISVGIINGATYEPAQPRIPQLGMQNWAQSTPVADEITLIPNPNNTSEDIFGNAVRDRLNSFNLDGSGYAANESLPTISGNISLSFWVKLDTFVSGNLGQILGRREGSSWLRVYRPYASHLRLEVAASQQYTFPVTENQWVYVAITINSSNQASVYVDDSAASGATLGTSFSFINTEVFTVGAWLNPALQPTSKLNGLVSDVLIYDRVLTSDEVENNYNAGLSAHKN